MGAGLFLIPLLALGTHCFLFGILVQSQDESFYFVLLYLAISSSVDFTGRPALVLKENGSGVDVEKRGGCGRD